MFSELLTLEFWKMLRFGFWTCVILSLMVTKLFSSDSFIPLRYWDPTYFKLKYLGDALRVASSFEDDFDLLEPLMLVLGL